MLINLFQFFHVAPTVANLKSLECWWAAPGVWCSLRGGDKGSEGWERADRSPFEIETCEGGVSTARGTTEIVGSVSYIN